jgi:hypothetical protein
MPGTKALPDKGRQARMEVISDSESDQEGAEISPLEAVWSTETAQECNAMYIYLIGLAISGVQLAAEPHARSLGYLRPNNCCGLKFNTPEP